MRTLFMNHVHALGSVDADCGPWALRNWGGGDAAFARALPATRLDLTNGTAA